MDCPVHLSAELAVVHHLKERMQRRGRDEPRAALGILPHDSDFSGKLLARGSGLERRVCVSMVRFGKCDQQRGSSDLQMGDGNRTI